MNYKFQYTDDASRTALINAHTDKTLFEDQILFADETGTVKNYFLVFSDTKPLEYQLQDLNNTTNIILLKQEGIV